MASAPGLVRRGRGVWFVGLALAGLVVGAAFVLQHQAISNAQAKARHAQLAADTRSHQAVTQVDKALDGSSLHHPLSKKVRRNVDDALKKVLAGQTGVAVRIWSPSAALRYSTLERDASNPDRDAIAQAAQAKGHSVSALDGEIMTTYLSLGSSGAAVEVVQPDPSYQAPDPGMLGFARGVGMVVAVTMAFLIAAGALLGRLQRPAETQAGFSATAPPDTSDGLESRGRRKEADPLAPTRPKPAVVPGEAPAEPATREKLMRVEQARQALEVELGQARSQLKNDNERATARVKTLEDQLGTTQARLQEALLAAEAANEEAARARAEAKAAPIHATGDDERVRALERELEAETMKAGAAEARAKGLEAQLRQQAEALEAAEAASAAAVVHPLDEAHQAAAHSADAVPTPDPDRVAELEAELAAAEERAREAEDRAARLQDRLVELDPAVAALEAWVPPSGTAADEEGGESFRARLVRNAARRKLGEESLSDDGPQRSR
jgi:hypothetical protein